MSNQLASELLYAGFDALDAMDFEKASYLFAQAFEHDSSNTTPLFHRGYCNLALKKYQDSFDDFDRVVKLDSGFLGARIERAKVAMDCNKVGFAREEWDRLVKQEADIPAVWSGRADFKSKYDGQPHSALKDAFQALHLDDEWDEAYSVLLWTLLGLGRFEDAIKIAETALKKIEFPFYMFADYGEALYYARRYNDACVAFENALKDDDYPPTDSDMYRYSAALYRAGRVDDALRKLNEMSDDKELEGIRLCLSGRIKLGLGEQKQALAELSKGKALLVRNYQAGASGQMGYGDRCNMAWFYALRAGLTEEHSLSDFDATADRSKAVDILSKLIVVSPQDLNHAKAYPEFDALWDDPTLAEAATTARSVLEKDAK